MKSLYIYQGPMDIESAASHNLWSLNFEWLAWQASMIITRISILKCTEWKNVQTCTVWCVKLLRFPSHSRPSLPWALKCKVTDCFKLAITIYALDRVRMNVQLVFQPVQHYMYDLGFSCKRIHGQFKSSRNFLVLRENQQTTFTLCLVFPHSSYWGTYWRNTLERWWKSSNQINKFNLY